MSGAAADLHMEWCFLHSTSRAQATHEFIESVQRLPLFNCITFSCEWKDSTYSKTKAFELIFTKTRVIFLDNTAFKMRLSIPYDDFLTITYDDTDFTLTYTPDGETEAEIQFTADTPRALFSKAVASVISEAEGNRVSENDISTYSFRTLSDIRQLTFQGTSENSENKENSENASDEDATKFYVVPRFPTVFLEDFMKMNETGSLNISTAELNHALLIRASACAFHLSVLLDKVTVNNARSLQREIGAYYSRLMIYLTYLIYDHRPYDTAYPMRTLMTSIGNEESKTVAHEIISGVIDNLDTCNKAFEPLSTDPIYLTSHNVVAYSLAHLISYRELPYAVADPNVQVFEDLTQAFLKNTLELKELTNTYIFSVGETEIKQELQKRLDYVFKNHLESLTLIQLITANSEFSDIDPSVILHQDSCNIMVTSMVRLSALLWADRTKLTDDQLATFLSQSAELAKHIIKEPPNLVIIRAIKDYSLILNGNLPVLVSNYRMIFGNVNSDINALISASDLQPTINMHIKLKILQVAVSLVEVQPDILIDEAKALVRLIKEMCIDMHSSTVHDIALFDLLPTEGENYDLCSLRCHAIRVVGHPKSNKPGDLLEDLIPVLALERMTKRSVSEWMNGFLNAYTSLLSFISSIAIQVVYKNEEAIKLSTRINEYGSIIPQPELLLQKQLSSIGSLSPEALAVVKFAEEEMEQNYWRASADLVQNHQAIKLLNDGLTAAAFYELNAVSMSIRSNPVKAFSAFPQCSLTLQMIQNSLYLIMKRPSYFSAPIYWFQLRTKLEAINNAINSYFSTNSQSIPLSTLNLFTEISPLLNNIHLMTIDTRLTSLWPVDVDIIPKDQPQFDMNKKKNDMSELMADYRIAKNDLLEVLSLRERDMISPLLIQMHIALLKMNELVKLVDEKSVNDHLETRFNKLCQVLIRVWSYGLGNIHLKDAIWDIDLAVDEAVEIVGNALFEIPSVEKVNQMKEDLLQKSINYPFYFAEFEKKFIDILNSNPNLSDPDYQTFGIDSEFEMLTLLRENNMLELKKAAKSYQNPKVLEFLQSDPYAKASRKWEKSAEDVDDSEAFIWFKDGVQRFLYALKFDKDNEMFSQESDKENMFNATGFKELTDMIDSAFIGKLETLSKITENIDATLAIGKNSSNKILLEMKENSSKASNYLVELQKIWQATQKELLIDEEFSGNALLYKNAMQQIIESFYSEFSLQLWDLNLFKRLCEEVLTPLMKGFNSSEIADSLLHCRRLVRKLRLTQRTARTRFIVDTERMVNKLELQLNKAFNGIEEKNAGRLERQRTVIESYVERFGKLRAGQMKKFIVRLMQNFAYDLSSFNTFEADQLSHSIIRLFDGMNSAADNRKQEIRTLINWLEQMQPGMLPIDQTKVIEMLKNLEARVAPQNEDEEYYIIDEGAIVDIAIDLSNALAHMASIRDTFLLLKDSHKLYVLKDKMTSFVMGIIRALEAYADEIHTFPCVSHPTLGVIKSVPPMCKSLSDFLEAGFLKESSIGQLALEAEEKIQAFLASCPEDLKEPMTKIAEEPILALKNLENPQ